MKSVFKMSAFELVQHEASQGQERGTSDLETALADKLTQAVLLLIICTEQLQDYSPNECVIGRSGDTNISELLAFCEVDEAKKMADELHQETEKCKK